MRILDNGVKRFRESTETNRKGAFDYQFIISDFENRKFSTINNGVFPTFSKV